MRKGGVCGEMEVRSEVDVDALSAVDVWGDEGAWGLRSMPIDVVLLDLFHVLIGICLPVPACPVCVHGRDHDALQMWCAGRRRGGMRGKPLCPKGVA